MPIPETPKQWPHQCYGVAVARFTEVDTPLKQTTTRFQACDLELPQTRIPFRAALAQLEQSHIEELEQARQWLQHSLNTCASPAYQYNGVVGSSTFPEERITKQPPKSYDSADNGGEAALGDGNKDAASAVFIKHVTDAVVSRDDSSRSSLRTWNKAVLAKWADVAWAVVSWPNSSFKSTLHEAWSPTLHDLVSLHGTRRSGLERQSTHNTPNTSSFTTLDLALRGVSSQSVKKTLSMQTVINGISRWRSRQSVEWRAPFHPTGYSRLVWDLTGLILCAYELIVLPVVLAKLLRNSEKMNIVSCGYWTFDLCMAFLTGYFTKDGDVQLKLYRIARKYGKSWFLFDLTLSLLDWVMLVFADVGISSRAMTSVIRLVRIARLLRIVKLAPRLQKQLGHMSSQFVFSLLRLNGYISMVILFNHYIACLWCATWTASLDRFEEGTGKSYKYLTGLHWSLSHCLLGSMDISPATDMERLFTCLVLVVSLVVFSTLLSMITNDALALRTVYEERTLKNKTLLSFVASHQLSSYVVGKIWHYVHENSLLETSISKPEAAKQTLALFPIHLQHEIQSEWFGPLLLRHPFFHAYDVFEPAAVKMLCHVAISDKNLLPLEQLNDQIWAKVTQAEHMLFVENGSLEYHPWDESDAVVTIKPGMWACEEALWSRAARIFGKMQAGTETCDLLLLGLPELREVTRLYPLSLNFVMRYAREFIMEFNRACTKFGDQEVLFNAPKFATSIVQSALASGPSVVRDSTDSTTSHAG